VKSELFSRVALVVSFVALSGTVSAQSASGPEQGHPHGPPTEALQACASLSDGTACTFTLDGQTVSGTCHTGPQGEPAACMPPHPHHGPPPEAFQACNGLSDGQACTVTFGSSTLTGTCRTGPEGGALACAPNGPPPGH